MRILRFLFIFLFSFPCLAVFAQDSNHVHWSVSTKNISGNKYEITVKGIIQHNWRLYAFENKEAGLEGLILSYNDSSAKISPYRILSVPVNYTDPVFDNKVVRIINDSVLFTQEIQFAEVSSKIKLKLNYDVGDAGNFIPEEQLLSIQVGQDLPVKSKARILIPSIKFEEPVNDCGTSSTISINSKSSGLLNLFLLGFLGGLVALLTPCVFPMIPLTVSFFTKKAHTRKAGIKSAWLYGFFIFLIYVLLSMPFHFLDKLNPEILNNISTNVSLNIFFFAIFLFFAFSFFGYYEIVLPAVFSSKADSKAGASNIIGIFFMALTLALVSFSCTGPILGSLLAGSLTGNGGAIQLTAGMGGFGLALALPFALFALFPNWLNSLPRSGGWLNTVKIVLGFIELGLAFKFLSNADLVQHWGLLKREVFIGIWVILGALLSLYLFGLIKFKHDSPIKKLSGTRLTGALLSTAFTLYLIPGLTNTKYANLSLISGFPPPLYYSIYHRDSDCVLGLNCTKDYEEGLQRARLEKKPILLDFTGYACVNCRRMEENVWSQPGVFELMKEKFIVISLYVDDKKLLPVNERFTYTTRDKNEKEINTVGDKWATFETENFMNNAQPLYAILDTNEILLTHPVGNTPSVTEYKEWLQCGLDAFNGIKRKETVPGKVGN